MKIAIIAPPFLVIPPKGQGGTENVLAEKIEELHKRGHKVTLFGCGNARVPCKYVKVFDKPVADTKIDLKSMEASRRLRQETAYAAIIISIFTKRHKEFDVIFIHARGGYLIGTLSQVINTSILCVMHLPIIDEIAEVFRRFPKLGIVSISNNQRKGYEDLNWAGTVYNGVNIEKFEFTEKPKDYFLWVGTIGEHKNPIAAIKTAKALKTKLIMAGKIRDKEYHAKVIEPEIDGKQIKYVGQINFKQKISLYRDAKAFLFPTIWQEPFGLVMIEALASGVPVIGWKSGAIPEVIEEGKIGFIVKSTQEMIAAAKKIDQIDRAVCRKTVEEKYSTAKMVDGYLKAAEKILKKNKK